MTSQHNYTELEALYPTIDVIDANWGIICDEGGAYKELPYDCGGVSPEIIKADKERRLLTMVDGDGSDVLFVVGFARVNRLGHYETQKPMPKKLYESRLVVDA